jgi:hypothetical protein
MELFFKNAFTFYPFAIFAITATFIAIAIDFGCGLRAAHKRGEITQSKKMKATIEKTVLYFSSIALFFLADICLCYFQWIYLEKSFPFISVVGTLFILFREGRSIYENTNKKTRTKVKQDFDEFQELAKKIKEIIEKNQTENQTKNNNN